MHSDLSVSPLWDTHVNFAITVCDQEGKLVHMNDKSRQTFQEDRSEDLLGKNALECHPPAAQAKLRQLLLDHSTHAYTIEKNGQNKLIYQTPWYSEGKFAGFVELSLILPPEMPHYNRDG